MSQVPSIRARSPARLLGASALLALAALHPGPASASDPAVTLTRVPGPDTHAVEIDGDIPVSGPFTVRHAVRPATRSATLYVWPVAIQPDCNGQPPPYDAPQSHVVEMMLTDAEPTRWAEAAVPHLQNDRTFCFRVQSSEGIHLPVDEALGLIASHVAAESIDDLQPWADKLARDVLETACAAAQSSQRRTEVVRCDADGWRPALRTRLMTTVLASSLPRARARRAVAERAHRSATDDLKASKARLAGLDPIVIPGRGLDLKAATALTRSPAEARAARETLDARVPGEQAWRRWLETFEDRAGRLDDTAGRYAAANDAVQSHTQTLEVELDDVTARFLTTEAHAERDARAATGAARSQDANNYVAAAAGVAVGWPLHGTGPWLLTYAGAHVFAEPVERSIPFDEMVGGSVLQRFSLFIGALTSTGDGGPGPIAGAGVASGLGGAYPGLGLGCRLTRYIAVDAMAFLYTAVDDDPLSTRRERGVALSFGLTAELDFIKWLTPD